MQLKKRGLIIINLGSPDSYAVTDVKNYLREFLMDERVIDIPPLLRHLLVKGIIVPFRASKSAEAYSKIWTQRGSPLKVITEDFNRLAQQKINMPSVITMRYGQPAPAKAYTELEGYVDNLEEVLIAPMYPHYAMSSYETALEHVKEYIRSRNKKVQLRILKPFYNEPAYITALADSIKPFLTDQSFDGFLFSYHGLPVRHLKKSDTTGGHCYASNDCCEVKSIAWQTCYKHQVKQTTELVKKELNLPDEKVFFSFQSRLGSDKWIQPYTDAMFEELPKKGIKKLLVICPAFVADCLETLEEIQMRGKESFIENGGETLMQVPCLNTSAKWVDAFAAYCNEADGKYAHLWN